MKILKAEIGTVNGMTLQAEIKDGLDKPYIDFRIFARRADGQYIPTQKGITISKDLAKYLKQAFNKID